MQEIEVGSQRVNENPVATNAIDDSSLRLHGTSGHWKEYSSGTEKQVKKISPNYGKSRSFVGLGIADPLLELLTSNMDEGEQCEAVIQIFSTLHPHDAFYEGEEPFPGTYDCRFCGQDLTVQHHPSLHVHSCARIDAVDTATRLLDQKYPYHLRCAYQACGSRDTLGQFVACNHVSASREEFYQHTREHLRTMRKTLKQDKSKVLSCFFGQCATHPHDGRLYRGGPDFATVEEQTIHLKTDHAIIFKKAATADFCEFCQEWIVDHDQQANHVHLEQVATLIKELGYAGVSGSRQFVPRFCIFCFHNPFATPSQKAFTYGRKGIVVHLEAHLTSIEDNQTCPAYPEFCSQSTPMTASDMRHHLEHVHCIQLPAKKRARKSGASNSVKLDVNDAHYQKAPANSSSSMSTIPELGRREVGQKRKALEEISENTIVARKHK